MATTHPYISGAGNIVQAVNHLRKSFPSEVDSNTVKKLGLAPNNESYVINALRFVGIIDHEGKKTPAAGKVFAQHTDDAFAKGLSSLVRQSYKQLFDLHGDKAWTLDKSGLITFFRSSDETGAAIGSRQAATFKAFAGLAGHGDTPTPRTPPGRSSKKTSEVSAAKKKPPASKRRKSPPVVDVASSSGREVGLTVRIEINIPADGDQVTYDRIFRSLRENLLND